MITLLLASLSLADVVGPEPTNCPSGSIGATDHSGPYCSPSECNAYTCASGLECRPVGLCVLEEERDCGGMVDPNQPCTYIHREAQGTCSSNTDCSGAATCVTADRCAAPSRGCANGPILPTMLVLGALVPLALRRRRASNR